MKLLPYERLNLRTSESPEAVVTRLDKMVAPGWFFLRNPPQPFRGTISGRHFKIARLLGTFLGLRYRNSWQPVIVGEVAAMAEGTEVRIRMRLHAFVAVFTALWFAFLLSFIAISLSIALRRGFDAAVPGLLVACGMGAVAYSLVSFSFWSEVKKARALLREGLKCGEVEGPNRLVRPS